MYGAPDPACATNGARIQADGVRLAYEDWTRCSWVHAWLRDPDQRQVAARELHRLAHTPLLVAHDGGGTVEHDDAVARAAAAGQRGPVAREERINCDGYGFAG
jgi:hypothetical protein